MRLPIRILIAEDEAPSRLRLRSLIARHADLRVVGECVSGREAVHAIGRHRPSLLFLDVEMPELNGFQVLRAVDPADLPVVVFVTAYDRYAVSAFGVQAIDYLLKPFDDERFDRTMRRVRSHFRMREALSALQRQVAGFREDATPRPRADAGSTRLAVPDGRGIAFLPASSVTHVSAEGCYARVHTVDRSVLIRESLTSLERRLPANDVARVHRSMLVNLGAVVGLDPLSHGEFRLRLTTGEAVKVSRRHRAEVLARLQQLSR